MEDLLLTAIRAADAAAAVHQRFARRIGIAQAGLKGRGDFVSRADVEAQEAALAVIRQAFPDHAVLAEEDAAITEDAAAVARGATTPGATTPGAATPGATTPTQAAATERATPDPASADPDRPLWVVDPLDGTANFLHTHPMHAASVAVALDGRPVAGAVACATTGERWWAARGLGAFKNGLPIRVSGALELEGSLVGTGFPFKVQHLLPRYLEQLGRVLGAGAGVRRGGAAALDLCYLAEGRLDGFWELFLSPWDFAAGVVIVEEAGGVMAGEDGATLPLAAGAVLGAGSGRFLASLIRCLDPAEAGTVTLAGAAPAPRA